MELPFWRITPTLHKVLAHSSTFNEAFGGTALTEWGEDTLEATQCRARNIRKFQCFTGNVHNNTLQCPEIS